MLDMKEIRHWPIITRALYGLQALAGHWGTFLSSIYGSLLCALLFTRKGKPHIKNGNPEQPLEALESSGVALAGHLKGDFKCFILNFLELKEIRHQPIIIRALFGLQAPAGPCGTSLNSISQGDLMVQEFLVRFVIYTKRKASYYKGNPWQPLEALESSGLALQE